MCKYLLRCTLCLTLFLQTGFRLCAQEQALAWDDFSETFLNAADENESELYSALQELKNNPGDINSATREDLLQLPFLSEEKVDSLLAYRERKRGFFSFGELMFVSRLSYDDRRFIPLFFTCNYPEENDTLRLGKQLYGGRHTLATRFDVPLYRRAGFRGNTESTKYFGKPFAHVLRYRYSYRDRIHYGLTLQQDEGEPWAVKKNYPYDYTSFYFSYRLASGKGEWLVGDYRLSSGAGLLLGNNFFQSRAMCLENPFRTTKTFSKNTSCDETNYFRGAAARFRWKKWQISTFLSYRKLDAVIRNDTVTSFLTSGLHRTIVEHERKGNTGALLAGANLQRAVKDWHLGLTAYYTRYSKTVYPALRPYNRYYLRGKDCGGLSFDYCKNGKRWSFQGEGAMDAGFHFAMTNMLRFHPASDAYSLTMQMRNFSPRFVAPYSGTLQAGSHTSNEHALLIGMNSQISPHTLITTYAEGFVFPRATYLAYKRSAGYELFAQVRQEVFKSTQKGDWKLNLQYRLKGRQQNVSGYKMLQFIHTHRGKLALEYADAKFNLLASLNANFMLYQTGKRAKGWAVSLRSRYAALDRLNISAYLAYFNTDDYQTRIYVYEPQLRYAAGFPTLYYHGARAVGMLQLKLKDWGECALRYGITHYFDRKTIGSGTQKILTANKQDLSIHLMMRI